MVITTPHFTVNEQPYKKCLEHVPKINMYTHARKKLPINKFCKLTQNLLTDTCTTLSLCLINL